MAYTKLLCLLCLVSLACLPSGANADAPKNSKRKLARSDGRRWDRLAQVAKAEIKSATQKFLQERDQNLAIPLEVDLLLLGFDGDGGYSYTLDENELSYLLNSMAENEICPTVWETGEPAAVCFKMDYVMLTPPDGAINRLEEVLRKTMVYKGIRKMDHVGVGKDLDEQVYSIAADGLVEDEIYVLLNEAYVAEGIPLPMGAYESHDLSTHRMAVVLLNPHKFRMSPMHNEFDANRMVQSQKRILEFWKKGFIHGDELASHEAGYTYRYSYLDRGASASWVSRHHFVVIDLSAGPVTFGPQATPGGELEPPAMPRILPVLLRMASELADQPVEETRTQMIAETAQGAHMLLTGQLAATVSSAARHLFAPDLRFERIEHAEDVLVPLIAVYDQDSADPLSQAAARHRRVDLEDVQAALDQLVDPHQSAVIQATSKPLHEFPAIAAALHKARVSRSAAALHQEPQGGLHLSHLEHVDAELLLRELMMAIPQLSDGSLAIVEDEGEPPSLMQHARHKGTRVLPVFVLTLTCAPEQMMFGNRQLLAANHDAVAVLQLVNQDDDTGQKSDGRVLSGHVIDGKPLRIDAARGVTANVVAGLAEALAGMVPPYERHDSREGRVVQDWRWAVGASPWGPFSHSSELSGIFSAVSRRNILVSHVEVAVRSVQKRLAKLDALVAERLTGPLDFLFEPGAEGSALEPQPQGSAVGGRQHLNTLTGLSVKGGHNASLPASTLEKLESGLGDIHHMLQVLAWDLWSQDYKEAQQSLEALLTAADRFNALVDRDLEAAEDAAACCQLHHETAVNVETMSIIAAGVFVIAVVLVMLVLVLRPGQGRRRLSRHGSSGGGSFSATRSYSGSYSNGLGRSASIGGDRGYPGYSSGGDDLPGGLVGRSGSSSLSWGRGLLGSIFSRDRGGAGLPMWNQSKGRKVDKFTV